MPGRLTNESPTYRVLMLDEQDQLAVMDGEKTPRVAGETGGRVWQIRAFSHTKVKVFEQPYADQQWLEP